MPCILSLLKITHYDLNIHDLEFTVKKFNKSFAPTCQGSSERGLVFEFSMYFFIHFEEVFYPNNGFKRFQIAAKSEKLQTCDRFIFLVGLLVVVVQTNVSFASSASFVDTTPRRQSIGAMNDIVAGKSKLGVRYVRDSQG